MNYEEIEKRFTEMNLFLNRVENLYEEIYNYSNIIFNKKYWAEKYTILIDRKMRISVINYKPNVFSSGNDNLFYINKKVNKIVSKLKIIKKFYKNNIENGKLEIDLLSSINSLNSAEFYCYSYFLICIFMVILRNIIEGKYDIKTNFALLVKNFDLYTNIVNKIEELFSLIKLGVEKYG
ncbi:MAG: hypothetical protein QW038_02790 [Nanopusillaceae archaeon]